MKRLLLLRHGKSSWDDPDLADVDRPLARRGEKATPRVARYMAQNGLIPDLVLCSVAARAIETWQLVSPELGPDGRVKFERGLYGTTAGRLLDRLRRLRDGPTTLMLLGHNPEIAALAARLCGDGRPKPMRRLAAKFPTAALAVIRLDIPAWTEVADGRGYLEAFETPKRLKGVNETAT